MKLRKTKLFDFLDAPLRSKFAWGAHHKSEKKIILAMWEPEVYWNKGVGIAKTWEDSSLDQDKRKNPNNEERGEMIKQIKSGTPGFCVLSKNDPSIKTEFGELNTEKDVIYKITDIFHNEKHYYIMIEKHCHIDQF